MRTQFEIYDENERLENQFDSSACATQYDDPANYRLGDSQEVSCKECIKILKELQYDLLKSAPTGMPN